MKAEDKIELKKIVLKVKGKELELSLDEARDLKNLLKDLLGDNSGIVYIPTVWTYPAYPASPYPTWTITTNGSTANGVDGIACLTTTN